MPSFWKCQAVNIKVGQGRGLAVVAPAGQKLSQGFLACEPGRGATHLLGT